MCAQPCRMKYSLYEDGNKVDTHGDKTQNNNLRIGILSHISGVCGGHPIAEVIHQADKLMYENKRMS
jgi:hypothetical protein